MKRTLHISAFACLFACAAALSAQQYVFRSFRQADGLKNLSINALATDKEGFLWVATENGAYRFLGSGFRRYGTEDGLAGLDVRAIVADQHGTIWVGTQEDLYRLDGDRFVRVGAAPIPIIASRDLALEDDRHLLVVDHERLYRLEHDAAGRTVSFEPAISADALAANDDLRHIGSVSILRGPFRDGEVWVAGGKHLYSFTKTSSVSGQSPLRMVGEWRENHGVPLDSWRQVVLDRNQTLWAAGLKHTVVLQPGLEAFHDRSIVGADHQSIYGHAPLVEDPQGRMLAAAGAGIARWSGDTWQFIGRANGFMRLSPTIDMVFDTSGDLFIGGRGDGLYFWAGYADWEGWNNTQELPSTSIWAITPERAGRVFLGTENGLAWLDPRTGESGRLSVARRWGLGRISAMGDNADGSLWATSYAGSFLRLDPKSIRAEEMGNLGTRILSGLTGGDGTVFLFTDRGVYLRKAGDSRSIPQPEAAANAILGQTFGIDDSVQSACESPDGTVWLVGKNRIVRFREDRWTASEVSGMSNLKGNLLSLSCGADGTLWVGGDETGVWHLSADSHGLRAVQLTLPPEWSSLAILTVMQDHRGWLWLGTDSGILVWNGIEWRHVHEETGLIWNDTNQGVFREGRDGSIWIGTSGGLSHLLHPEDLFEPMRLSISLILARRGTHDFSNAAKIVMPEEGAPLQLQASSPSMRNRSEMKLRLLMVGMNREWVDTPDGLATFTRLSPGSYTFTAMACNPSFNACSSAVSLGIVVRPPWWKTVWFYIVIALLLLVLYLVGLRIHAGHLRKKSRELESLVSERTRELEQSREQLRVQATHDSLTGVLNRGAILSILDEEMERALRQEQPFVVALVDIDHFKRINDTHGHIAGDEALRRFAAALRGAIRPYDRCGRYGGEEFLVVLPDLPTDAAAQRLASMHRALSHLPVCQGAIGFAITCSIGAVLVIPPALRIRQESLLAIADGALYDAKAAGRNRFFVRLFDPVNSSADERSSATAERFERDLSEA